MIPLPDPSSISKVADWIELNLSLHADRLSKAEMSSTIDSLTGNEPSESFISDVWRELEYRHRSYRHPMFRVTERTVERRAEVDVKEEYLACIILSLYGVQGTTRDPAKLFERITSRAVKSYLSANSIVFGWPALAVDETVDDEYQIKRKIRRVADELGERFIEAPPARFNDRGVDVIGWISFGEGRSSQLVLLVQCYAGQDWKRKLPVPLDSWYQYIHWAFNPIKGFAVPVIISERDWHEGSTDKGLLFDRPRIVNLLAPDTYDPALADELTDWVQAQVAELDA